MPVELSPEAKKDCEAIIGRYPEDWRQAAILPVLHRLQREWGYISLDGLKCVADLLGMPAARAAGVMSFYPMFHKAPVGRHVIYICSTLSCALCGSKKIVNHLKEKLDVEVGETTADGKFTLEKAECIAACEGAPAVLIDDTLHRYVTTEKLDQLLAEVE